MHQLALPFQLPPASARSFTPLPPLRRQRYHPHSQRRRRWRGGPKADLAQPPAQARAATTAPPPLQPPLPVLSPDVCHAKSPLPPLHRDRFHPTPLRRRRWRGGPKADLAQPPAQARAETTAPPLTHFFSQPPIAKLATVLPSPLTRDHNALNPPPNTSAPPPPLSPTPNSPPSLSPPGAAGPACSTRHARRPL